MRPESSPGILAHAEGGTGHWHGCAARQQHAVQVEGSHCTGLRGVQVLAAVFALLAVATSRAVADDPVVTAELGPSPDSYYISGSGFTPGQVVNIVELACPDLPCAGEGIASVRDVVVDADGSFRVLLQAHPEREPTEGQATRLIVVQEPGVVAGVEGMPFVKVPHHHPGVGPPGAGTGWYGGSPPVLAQVALIAAFGVTVIVLAAAAWRAQCSRWV